jgi:GxxExxY protein
VVEEKIILEVKAVQSLTDAHSKQTLNYIAVAQLQLGILVNFGESYLSSKRIAL